MVVEKIRIGIIGAGQNTRKTHIPKLQAIPGVEIVEVVNRSTSSSQKVAEEFGIRQIRSNWEEVASSDAVDAVVIGTWPYLHCEASCPWTLWRRGSGPRWTRPSRSCRAK